MNPQVAEFFLPDQEILQEVLVYFLDEVGEHLSALRRGFQAFCLGGSDLDSLTELYHSVHTLKGSSSTVGLIHFSNNVRRLESAVHTFQDPNLQRTAILQSHLFEALDCLQGQIDAIQCNSCEDPNLQPAANRVFTQLEIYLSACAKDEQFVPPTSKALPMVIAFSEDCQELLSEFEQRLHQGNEVQAPLQLLLTQVKGLAQLCAVEGFEQICLCAERALIIQVPTVTLAQTILTELKHSCDALCLNQETAIMPSAALLALGNSPQKASSTQDNQDLHRKQILQVMDQIRNNGAQIRRLNNQIKQLYNRLFNDHFEIDSSGLNFQSLDVSTGRQFSNIQELVAHLNKQVSGVSHLVEKARENTSFLRKNIDALHKPTKRMPASQERSTKPRVLVVDDSAALRHMLILCLQRIGFDSVDVACDGQEALAMLQQAQYRLVISDIEMPKLNGFELLSQMQSSTRLAKIPLIFLTSCVGEQYRQLAIELGACGYLNKPHCESDLRRAIYTAIGQEISA
jgi:CheY-like chemotaxis protein/HPt (histidine-containing phosphotransfer) domain-containing protein